MKFGKLILRKIITILATRCLILGLKNKNRFRLGLRSRPRWGSLQRSPDPLAGFGALLLRGGREREGERKGKGEDDCYSKLFKALMRREPR